MLPAKPVMLVFPFPLLAHYLRCIVLARSYVDEYAVSFKAFPAYRHFVEKEGFTSFSCADFDAGLVMRDARRFSFSWINEPDCERIFSDQVRCILEYKPAIVLGDMSPTLKMACQFTGVHYISLINGYMSNYYALPRPVATTHPAYKFSKIVPRFVFRSIATRQERKAFLAIQRPLNSIRRKYQLPLIDSYLQELEGDGTLICDYPEVFPQRDLPGSYCIIGPLLYSHDDVSFDMPMPAGRKTIVVTLGSSGEWSKVQCLADKEFSDFNIIVAGEANNLPMAAHITAVPFIPLNDILQRADLVICHGGNGTLNFAYMYCVPFIAVPSIMDQEWNALRFAQLMRGCMLTGRISTRRMRKAINKMLAG